MRKAVESIYDHIQAEPLDDEITVKLHHFMIDNRTSIQRLLNGAELLSEKLNDQSPQFVLCHSDIHAGNVLLDGNSTIYIVDWDEPILAPKERDLMFIGGGVGNVWNNPHEEMLFYKGYGKTEIHSIALAYYRHERIIEDIAIYTQQLLLTTSGGKDRPVMYGQFLAMFELNGVVDIALKTDENLSG